MNIILLIVIRNSYVSLIRYSVIPPLHWVDSGNNSRPLDELYRAWWLGIDSCKEYIDPGQTRPCCVIASLSVPGLPPGSWMKSTSQSVRENTVALFSWITLLTIFILQLSHPIKERKMEPWILSLITKMHIVAGEKVNQYNHYHCAYVVVINWCIKSSSEFH